MATTRKRESTAMRRAQRLGPPPASPGFQNKYNHSLKVRPDSRACIVKFPLEYVYDRDFWPQKLNPWTSFSIVIEEWQKSETKIHASWLLWEINKESNKLCYYNCQAQLKQVSLTELT